MRILHRQIVIVSLTTGLAALCLGKVKAQFDKSIDFSRYKTYQWLPPRVLKKTGLEENDAVISPMIKAAVNRELQKRHLMEVPQGGDLQVSSVALAESIPNIDALIYPGNIPVAAGTLNQPIMGPVGSIGRYNKEGTVVVNLIDSATKKTAWVGLATGSVNGSDYEPVINKAATDMFKKYPVKP
jgi:hypothetical protein